MAKSAPGASSLPRLPAMHLPRPRLSEPLLGGEARVRLLFAPAGYGKSVLLNQCVRQAPAATRVVWLDLAGAAVSVATLLRRVAHCLGQPARRGDPLEALLGLLGNAGDLWLVLDDYPRSDSDGVDASFNQLLLRAPPTVSWWVSSRRLPQWSLPRLLLQGDLAIFDRPALALTRSELSTLLALLPPLRASLVARQCLFSYSAGWFAVVRLLLDCDALPLPRRLREGTPLLAQYLQAEVLSAQPREDCPALSSGYQGHAPEAVLRRFAGQPGAQVEVASPVLSPRELMVLRLIARGCSNQEIAEQLEISLHTVKTHTRRINRKLDVRRRTEAVSRARSLGYLGR